MVAWLAGWYLFRFAWLCTQPTATEIPPGALLWNRASRIGETAVPQNKEGKIQRKNRYKSIVVPDEYSAYGGDLINMLEAFELMCYVFLSHMTTATYCIVLEASEYQAYPICPFEESWIACEFEKRKINNALPLKVTEWNGQEQWQLLQKKNIWLSRRLS